LTVIPAQAGIQKGFERYWIPAFAGMTTPLDALFGGVFQKAKLIRFFKQPVFQYSIIPFFLGFGGFFE